VVAQAQGAFPKVSRRWLAFLLASVALVLPSCSSDGHLDLFGYTSRPNYDLGIRTVSVPIFKNVSFRRGLEFDLTRAVIREIESKTPYKVVSAGCPADTELTGTIINLAKSTVNVNQLNEIRDSQTTLTVEIVWKDLRTGEILSREKSGPSPDLPPGAPPPPPPPPVRLTSVANLIPELGNSITTAEQQNVNRLAVQIVSMMEKPW
jgi:hypothetical protein